MFSRACGWGVTANGFEVFEGCDILKLIVGMDKQLCKYTEVDWIIHVKQVKWMVCILVC